MEEGQIEKLWDDLQDWYRENEITKARIAFSGGKDSTLVLDSALATPQVTDVKALIRDSEVYPDREIREAKRIAEKLNAPYKVISSTKLEDPHFKANPEDRCFYCKRELLTRFDSQEGGVILEGTNASEVKGHRPGLKAVEKHARAPLLEVGLGDIEIRKLLKWRGREVWDRPSYACLASRFPSGVELTKEKLKKVEDLEEKIFQLGVKQLRLRDFGETGRLEVWPEDMEKILKHREKILDWMEAKNFQNVFLDLKGYRTGSISTS